jgi:tripartite-type tricarboxylate transporter receptor subunit TctC
VKAAPDIPTIAEQGLPNYAVEGWFAVIGPPKMQPADVQRVHDAVAAAFTSAEVRDAMDKQGNIIKPTSPEQAASYFRSEAARYAALVKKANVVLE